MPDLPFRRLTGQVATAISLSNRRSKDASPEEIGQLIMKLKEAIELIESSGWSQVVQNAASAPEERQTVASMWADCLGMIAGHYRRLGEPESAFDLLDQGAKLELDPELKVKSSYCAVNLISMLIEAKRKAPADLMPDIERTIEKLNGQTVPGGARETDPWAYADLGQLHLLKGNGDAAKGAYDDFVRRAKKAGEVDSVLRVLRLLRQTLADIGDPNSETLAGGISYLVERRNEAFPVSE
jgi:tetratricopeptide (TPR) repeat protein